MWTLEGQNHRTRPSRSTSLRKHSEYKSLDVLRGWDRRCQFLSHTLSSPLEHGRPPDGTTLAYNNFADVKISLHDAGETRVEDSVGFCTRGTWLEKHFRTTETHSDKHDV